MVIIFVRETQFVSKAQKNCASQEKGAASLHIFWHRAGWLVLLLLCQSSSSFILQRPLGHEDRCQMQDTNLTLLNVFFMRCACISISHLRIREPWIEMISNFNFWFIFFAHAGGTDSKPLSQVSHQITSNSDLFSDHVGWSWWKCWRSKYRPGGETPCFGYACYVSFEKI